MAKKNRPRRKRGSIMGRSDISYVDRLRIQQNLDIGLGREQAARMSMWCYSIALHDAEGIGYKRLVRFSERFMELDEEWYADPELAMARTKRRFESMGMEISGEVFRHEFAGATAREQEVRSNRLEAAQAALLCGVMAANDVFGLGRERLERVCNRCREISAWDDKRILEELEQIGFQVVDGHVLAFLDEEGKAVKVGTNQKRKGTE